MMSIAVHHAVARRDAGAARPVEADAVHFVEIGQRAVFLREIAKTLIRPKSPSIE